MTAPHRIAMALMVGLLGCPEADDDPAPTADSGEPAYECDPVGADPAVGALLNAPLADDVEVIQKVPQHPGNPGPEDLP